ncbi:lipoprotein [Paraburkholderia sp. CNPSo 3272]|uniref:LPS translocon maturation chaperone LptM n=1 Tax=Paraburkholderia sp. CNPSo 3272 TaxID=2940931 RepID=UPI0020B63EFF|nr:lipoprotein [Paraburkholderia sp. CNPSo 3272]MCP3725495.1 lipoprotein [Paraburkholderia sp. CNPSo 3272]
MRVISRTRAAAPSAWTPRAILAAFAIGAAALAGCGQRGALYMPTVPPLPPKPNFETTQPETGATPASAPESASAPVGTIPDTSGTPLSLSPDTELGTTPATTGSPQAASDATPIQ